MAKSASGQFETRVWYTDVQNLSDHGDKQETWMLMTVYELVELRSYFTCTESFKLHVLTATLAMFASR